MTPDRRTAARLPYDRLVKYFTIVKDFGDGRRLWHPPLSRVDLPSTPGRA